MMHKVDLCSRHAWQHRMDAE